MIRFYQDFTDIPAVRVYLNSFPILLSDEKEGHISIHRKLIELSQLQFRWGGLYMGLN